MQDQDRALSEDWIASWPGSFSGTSPPKDFFGKLCPHHEGWGPYSPDRYDWSLCFEFSTFYAALSALALIGFWIRIRHLRRHGKEHHFGRTGWIFWPSQVLMTLAALSIWIVAGQMLYFGKDEREEVLWIGVLGCAGMGTAWILAVLLNIHEHRYEIRSSSAIFSLYLASIPAAATILHTTIDLGHFSATVTPHACFIMFLTLGLVVEAWPRGNTRVQLASTKSRYEKANLFSRLSFFFFQPVINIGIRRTLTVADIANQLPDDMRTEYGYQKLSVRWNARVEKQRQRAKASGMFSPPSLFWTILQSHRFNLLPVALARIAIVLLSYTLPALLSRLLSYLDEHQEPAPPVSYGITLAVGMFVASFMVSLLNTYNRYQMLTVSVSTRSALISIIYRKALRLSPGARQISSPAEIQNHMSVDADQWWDAIVYLSMWVSIPLELVIAMTMLYNLLGWSMLAGVAGMVSLLPLQAWQARVFEKMQKQKLVAMDKRIRVTTEVLSGIKIVKLYGWESAFLERILGIRKAELAALKKIGMAQAFMSIVFMSSSLIISLITFGVYASVGGPDFTPGKLTPQTVFVGMALVGMLRGPIASLSDATTTTISVLVGTRRIQDFLLREEVNEKDILRTDSLPRDPSAPVISIKDASFSWAQERFEESPATEEENQPLLSDQSQDQITPLPPTLQFIDLAIPRGSLTAIVGRVGQGKSSLLSALTGEMYKLKGQVEIAGRIAIVPQQAWICNATLRDNVLFGNPYDETKYQRILHACGLEPDIAMLPGGDLTEIGERGINLSGGQKQRVSLARAAYEDADIYLLDDPLSAVDAHVDQHLWTKLIGPKTGLLREKTRVLVTHGIHHLRDMDQIVVIKEGQVAEKGHYRDLMKAKEAFYALMIEFSNADRQQQEQDVILGRRRSSASLVKALHVDEEEGAREDSEEEGAQGEDGSSSEDVADQGTLDGSSGAMETISTAVEIVDVKKDTKAELVAAEKMKEGEVGLEVCLVYIRAVSYKMTALIVLLFILAQLCLVGTNLWLKHWIAETKEAQDKVESYETDPTSSPPSLKLFLGVYALLTLTYVLLYVVVMWLGLSVARIRAAETIFRRLASKILRLPMSFFDTTPLGRLLNRFSSDVGAVDQRVPNKLLDMTLFGISVTSTLVLITFTSPLFLIVAPFLMAGLFMAQALFLGVSRTLARIYSVSKSPVYQNFAETLGGVGTIRAMRCEERFIGKNSGLTDTMSNNFLSNMSSRRWLDVQLRLLSTLVVFMAALLAVLGRGRVDPSLAGMTLSFALAITEEVTSLVRTFCDLQNQLVGVERVLELTDLQEEAPAVTDVPIPAQWPQEGRIKFINYSARYREGLDLVIKNIDLDISPGLKVGIVGRTGAGKSSLTLALFRIIEAANSYWAKQSDQNKAVLKADLSPTVAAAIKAAANAAAIKSASATGPLSVVVKVPQVDAMSEGAETLTASASGSIITRTDRDGSGEHVEEEEEDDGGRIEIDGIDISTVGLDTLRQHLAIIPQDPTLFAGTVRENLDPFHTQEDIHLWAALERAHLKQTIQSLPGQLSAEVSPNGENFSVGQRSLICLARALLRPSKILILDEATAAVDVETDELIQQTIRTEFKDRTVLTIAHRIKTIMDGDRVLVLERGRVREFDVPGVLLKRKESLFFKLAEQAGEV